DSSAQLGLEDFADRGSGFNQMGSALPVIDLGKDDKDQPIKATAISAGGSHTCALLESGDVKCWGANNNGQLGLGIDNKTLGGNGNEMKNLPPVNLGSNKKAVAVAAGGSHTCALLDDDTIQCWGHNDGGQLGLGVGTDKLTAPHELTLGATPLTVA